VQGNLGNACFKCQKTTKYPTATNADIGCDKNAPRCVDAGEGKLEDVGQLGFGCTTCQDVFYKRIDFGTTKNYNYARDNAPADCILTPISSVEELSAVAKAAKNRCWVGITAPEPVTGSDRLARANNFDNPASAQGVPVGTYPDFPPADIDDFWVSGEPNGTGGYATIQGGKLSDIGSNGVGSTNAVCAIYKCCKGGSV
jgi:hypothetical protein